MKNRNRAWSGRPKSSSSEDNVAAIDAVIAKDLEKSVRRIAAELDLPKTYVHCIIRGSLSLYPYRLQILQQQREANEFSCLEFCDTFSSRQWRWTYYPASNSMLSWILALGLSGGQSVPRPWSRNTGATQAEHCSGSSENWIRSY